MCNCTSGKLEILGSMRTLSSGRAAPVIGRASARPVGADPFASPRNDGCGLLRGACHRATPWIAWLSNVPVTAVEILGGFCLGAFVGITLAVLFCWSPLVSLLLLPLFVTLNMIPKVALGPLFIVWFSYGIFANILIAFSICFFPILLTTARGLSEVEPDLRDLVKSLRGSRWTLCRKIQLPGSLPSVS